MRLSQGRRREDKGRIGKLRAHVGGRPDDDPILRDEIISLLLRWRAGVVAGTVCSIVVWVFAWAKIDASWPLWFIAADLAMGIAKWTVANNKRLDNALRRARAVDRLKILSLAWASLLGIGIALCIASGDPTLATLSVGVGAGSIGVATFRNAPTPSNARILVLCVVVPPAVAGYFLTSGTLSLLGLCLVPWCASLFAMIGQNHEIIKQAAMTRIELRRIARIDPLTGLENRRAFHEYLSTMIAPSGGRKATLLYLDLDQFKAVNDQHGHEAGDVLLIEVARRIRSAVRARDRVFRLGGDEFAVVIRGLPERDIARRAGEMIEQITQPTELSPGVIVQVGLSIGGARLTSPGRNVADVIRAADEALYRAKADGKGRYVAAPA